MLPPFLLVKSFLEGLPKNGKIHTIDNNEELVTIQNKYFKKSGFEKKIFFYLGNAVGTLS